MCRHQHHLNSNKTLTNVYWSSFFSSVHLIQHLKSLNIIRRNLIPNMIQQLVHVSKSRTEFQYNDLFLIITIIPHNSYYNFLKFPTSPILECDLNIWYSDKRTKSWNKNFSNIQQTTQKLTSVQKPREKHNT